MNYFLELYPEKSILYDNHYFLFQYFLLSVPALVIIFLFCLILHKLSLKQTKENDAILNSTIIL